MTDPDFTIGGSVEIGAEPEGSYAPGYASGSDLLEALAPGGPYRCLVCGTYEHGKRVGIRGHLVRKHKLSPLPAIDWEAIDPDGPHGNTTRAAWEGTSEPQEGQSPDGTESVVISLSSTARRALVAQTKESLEAVGGLVALSPLHATGFGVQNRADRLAVNAVVIAERNPAFMRWLRRFNTAMAGGEMGKLVSELALCAAYDVGAIRPEKMLAIGPVKVPGAMVLSPIAVEIGQVEQMKADMAAMEAELRQGAA